MVRARPPADEVGRRPHRCTSLERRVTRLLVILEPYESLSDAPPPFFRPLPRPSSLPPGPDYTPATLGERQTVDV